MSTLLKDLYSPAFYNRFSDVLATILPSFSKQEFLQEIFNDRFAGMELKERMKHTSQVLYQFFPKDFREVARLLEQLISRLRQERFTETSIEFMFLPDYIETYGLEDFENSVRAIEFTTQFTSCEFAVRPFTLKYGERMISQMTAWSLHPDYRVRRLASEGTRPRLPWAMALPELKKDPSPILPLLENLRNDPSEWVRRSVANNLNDIAKDNPEIVVQLLGKWRGISKETDAILKHGCRTLLKQGHPEVLKHYGLESDNILLADFTVLTPEVKVGEALYFAFSLVNKYASAKTVRTEYAIYYRKQNGTLSKKVFKISERVLQANGKINFQRKQSFKPITTRRFYPGQHQLSVIVNGQEKQVENFVVR